MRARVRSKLVVSGIILQLLRIAHIHVPLVAAAADDLAPPFRLAVDGTILDTGRVGGHCGPCSHDVDGDGRSDLVVGDYSGSFRVASNAGDRGRPVFKDGGRLLAGGGIAKVRISCCVAAQPRFCDLDGDGFDDLLANSFDPGHCHVFRGQADGGFAPGAELTDTSGTPVRACPQQARNSDSFGSFFEPVDWDDDGDIDLLIGCFDGGLKLRLNEGSATKPAFATHNLVVAAADGPLRVPRHCCPNVADWDGDGRWDILSGSEAGGVWWFRNVGETGRPRFAAGLMLVDTPSRAEGFLNINVVVPGVRTQTEVADYDGDGRLDLIVGDYAYGYDFKPDLSPHDMQRCQSLFNAYVSASDQDRRSAEEAFHEGIRPYLRTVDTGVADGTDERGMAYRMRGNAWIFLRREGRTEPTD